MTAPAVHAAAVVLLVLGAALTAALAAYGLRFRTEMGAQWFVATMALASLWSVVAIVEVLVATRVVQVTSELFSTAVAAVLPAVWFCFVLDYTGRWVRLGRARKAALWAVPVIALASLATSPLHELYYVDFEVVAVSGRPVADPTPGPVAILLLAYNLLVFAAGLAVLGEMLADRDGLFSGQGFWLLTGTLAPVALTLASLFSVGPPDVPLLPMGFAVLGFAYVRGLYRHRLFDLVPGTRRIGVGAAFDDLSEGVIVVDADRRVVRINETAREQFDCDRDSVLGSSVDVVSPGLLGDPPRETISEVIRGTDVFEVTTSPVEGPNGRTVGHALLIRDVTTHQTRKQRLEVFDRILRHNLRNDMTVVLGNASELRTHDDPEVSRPARRIEQTAEELVSLARKARAVDRTVGGATSGRRSVDPGELVAAVTSAVRSDHPGPRIATTVEVDRDVVTDPEALEVLLSNLVENAVVHGTDGVDQSATGSRSATADGGTPTPDGDGEGAGGDGEEVYGDGATDVRVAVRPVVDGVVFEVADDGPGIPDEELAVVERGTETDLSHSRSLGLWLVRWSARHIDATVSFDTRDGTTVRVVVPDGAEDG